MRIICFSNIILVVYLVNLNGNILHPTIQAQCEIDGLTAIKIFLFLKTKGFWSRFLCLNYRQLR